MSWLKSAYMTQKKVKNAPKHVKQSVAKKEKRKETLFCYYDDIHIVCIHIKKNNSNILDNPSFVFFLFIYSLCCMAQGHNNEGNGITRIKFNENLFFLSPPCRETEKNDKYRYGTLHSVQQQLDNEKSSSKTFWRYRYMRK